MKKLIIIAALIIAGFAAYILINKQTKKVDFTIAIFTPTTHPALEEIEQGFRDTLQKSGPLHYKFITYNANGNKTLQRAQAEEIVNTPYDLIFTIGASCSQLVAQLSKKKGVTTPIVFSAVDDPVGIGIINSLESSGNNVTGVALPVGYGTELKLLKKLKPETKNILLVYDPLQGTGLEKYKTKIKEILEQQGMNLRTFEVHQANEIAQIVAGLIADIDVILVLKDNTVVSAIDSLITLCNRHGITLLVSDLNSGRKGAALAYGVEESQSGVQAAEIARTIIIDHVRPTDIAIAPVSPFKLEVNTKTMSLQNLKIDEHTLKTIKTTGTIGD
jgi:putative ABC transport system substrate-binding protein